VGMAAEQARNLGLEGMRQKRSRAGAQKLGQRIGKSSWLRELENISLGHGVSLLCWRSGGIEHSHDTPPYPFTPSPTFAHSSRSIAKLSCGQALSSRLTPAAIRPNERRDSAFRAAANAVSAATVTPGASPRAFSAALSRSSAS